MKKIGIITINDIDNYGNRLQNYALQEYCKRNFKCDILTLKNNAYSNDRKFYLLRQIKHIIRKRTNVNNISFERKNNFLKFNEHIKYFYKKINAFTNLNYFDYIIVGSDQVWNPFFRRLRDVDILKYVNPSKRISYAASFGVNQIPNKYKKKIKKELPKFKAISVRELEGKKIIEENTSLINVDILVDPTMLLTIEEWDNVSKKPKMLKKDKYILNYFLGSLSEEKKTEINRVAKENDCEIINILDENSPYYECGPSEFLWLEKNAFLICTDSFHSCVFAILYNKPFIIFDREQDGLVNMNSRIDTLLTKFKLKNRKFENKITTKNLNHNYSEAYKILEEERQKSKEFLEKALDLKEG